MFPHGIGHLFSPCLGAMFGPLVLRTEMPQTPRPDEGCNRLVTGLSTDAKVRLPSQLQTTSSPARASNTCCRWGAPLPTPDNHPRLEKVEEWPEEFACISAKVDESLANLWRRSKRAGVTLRMLACALLLVGHTDWLP